MRPRSMPTQDESWCSLEGRIYQGMFGGIAIYCNPSLPAGTVELRNPDGEVIAVIHGVKQVDSRGRLS